MHPFVVLLLPLLSAGKVLDTSMCLVRPSYIGRISSRAPGKIFHPRPDDIGTFVQRSAQYQVDTMMEFDAIPPSSVNCTLSLVLPQHYQVEGIGEGMGLNVWNVNEHLPRGQDGVYGLVWERAPEATTLFGETGDLQIEEGAANRTLTSNGTSPFKIIGTSKCSKLMTFRVAIPAEQKTGVVSFEQTLSPLAGWILSFDCESL
ncbi:hypothetical protein EJ04DRAFT_578306 [Polyplosphaeria fusca]|uniref:Ubiquitin 3 binding protein But2 C-terminal domain-containing protein n=1 Tax=Polyplosphaeria fusca TaxID=682080 RepID=A0A9P4UZK8_9PLEO|nr:hypothetical protein EJ04DRAFT_578306 [Polyplosphaeria fusca]